MKRTAFSWAGAGLAAGVALACYVVAACSTDVVVKPDPSGASSGATMGDTTAVSSGASSSVSSGAGGSGPGPGCCGPVQIQGPVKIVTAETDPDQYVIGSAPMGGMKMADGPFFLTDALSGETSLLLYTVTGNDCSSAQKTNVLWLPAPIANTLAQAHGIRLAVPKGHALCSGSSVLSFGGFKPY